MTKTSSKTGDIKKVVIFGSGGLRIGQAGEFDYSGSQAIKAFKQEGIYTVLINPNIATVQTDNDMADRVYFQPLNPLTVTEILEAEKPDAVALSFGGQTALNLGLALYDEGVFKRLGIKVLGTGVEAIKTTEDRELFKKALDKIGTKTAVSQAASSLSEATRAAKKIGYPIMLRSGYSLGGLGSGRIDNEEQLKERVSEVLKAVPQVLIEEYLHGWKEVEYEVVRDISGNTITVCNMENLDPMGIHTGESIVVAPSQTLTNEEYHRLRAIAIKTINSLGIVGECNIQYALNPANGDYRVIEVNARLSRSSALASKATGYPLAFVAAKLMLGQQLTEIKNSVTGVTSAFFEPALDYLAVKMPRWDLGKLKASDHHIGSEMKSVGEVMGLGRSFPEALQKAIRMLNIGADGLSVHSYEFEDVLDEISHPTDRRLFAIYEAIRSGVSLEQIHELSRVDMWFLYHLKSIHDCELEIKGTPLNKELLTKSKRLGFSDKTIGILRRDSEEAVRQARLKDGIKPVIKLIDTLAGEFAAETNYLFTTYHGESYDVSPLKHAVAVIGSGPYSIGSSVEFDWSAVNTAKTLERYKYKSIMINSNPETVSTDFDRSARLYFEELTLERVRDIADFEKPDGIIVSVGGQIANNLALPLSKSGHKILGTPPLQIDRAEDRQKFSSMLGELGIDQPKWQEVTDLKGAKKFAEKVGYPVLIRPSYVLSGGAMNVVKSEGEMQAYLDRATSLSPDHPVVISRFIDNAKELEIDGVAKNGRLIIYAISEHIENAGVHSGDATVVYPAQRLYLETVRRAKHIAKQVAKGLDITGPFNIQFIAKDNDLKVIECNVRSSRSFPFVSKVSGYNFIEIATEAMLGVGTEGRHYQTLELDHVAVKTPQFSYNRLKGADPVASVEMASTGEVACFGDNLEEAFYRSWLATEQQVKGKSVFISVPDEQKHKFLDEAAALQANGWKIYATAGTHSYFKEHGISTTRLHKIAEKKEPSVAGAIKNRKVDLVVSVPRIVEDGDAYTIRRLAIDNHLPLITNAETGRLLIKCLADDNQSLAHLPKAWQTYVHLDEPGRE